MFIYAKGTQADWLYLSAVNVSLKKWIKPKKRGKIKSEFKNNKGDKFPRDLMELPFLSL